MISLYHKIQRIETLQQKINRDTKAFKNLAGINCDNHCAECCRYQDISATTLEFLPFAWHASKLGVLDYWFDKIEQHASSQCIFALTGTETWGCSIYPARGLICRLFGFSAVTDKNGLPVYGACRVLNQRQPAMVDQAQRVIAAGGKVPVMASYYRQLAAIDPLLGVQSFPINQAIKNALETVYFHLHYREAA
ncbi:MAG TPA: YkgJ family cysteine cluster protein [Candidatus Rifleibacterium sp.]|nr:YkgJ family cysteine cluster protein [Candidatus Rifleibacterium sp.]HPT44824.1 YkgJ family cysteine cluster protein [Candidatus Rifleibacterium sp.]